MELPALSSFQDNCNSSECFIQVITPVRVIGSVDNNGFLSFRLFSPQTPADSAGNPRYSGDTTTSS